ncbi:ABC transporter substrate-binding protein [Changpingibacter yushuensis]|uniref:ABC transporter substrate-binding protein n=1 Tax=Changpingibacter yushuensis TaxID=2758440 RepID=UPI0015F7108F|nr:ABC transporter substrate-binding protein [Changpingibacter yushuensis]
MKKILAVVVGATLALAGCSSQSDDSATGTTTDTTKLTLGLTYIPDIQFAPFYVALENGYFADEGLDVTLRHHGSQEALLGALQSGEEDAVFAGGDEMLQGRSNGIDVVNWATMYQDYPVTLIVPADSDITSIADLKGHSVGLPGEYGENYFALLAMMNAAGFSDSDIDVQYIGYTQAAALASGQVDAIIGYSNSDLVTIASALSGDGSTGAADLSTVRSIDLVDGGLPLVAVGMGSLSENLSKNKEAYVKVLAALDKAIQFCTENPDEAVDISAKYVTDLVDDDRKANAKQVLEQTLKLYTAGDVFGEQDADLWNSMGSFMDQNGLLGGSVDVTEAFVDLTK